jgi:hypothetical protein
MGPVWGVLRESYRIGTGALHRQMGPVGISEHLSHFVLPMAKCFPSTEDLVATHQVPNGQQSGRARLALRNEIQAGIGRGLYRSTNFYAGTFSFVGGISEPTQSEEHHHATQNPTHPGARDAK